jgi:hypothetical protein
VQHTQTDKQMKDIVDLDLVKQILKNNVNIVSEFRTKYHFQGDTNYLHLFDSLLIFYDKELFDKLDLKFSELKRLKNAYFWYSKYIGALRKQHFATSDHEEVKFKIIEEIDRLDENVDWLFLKEIDELL